MSEGVEAAGVVALVALIPVAIVGLGLLVWRLLFCRFEAYQDPPIGLRTLHHGDYRVQRWVGLGARHRVRWFFGLILFAPMEPGASLRTGGVTTSKPNQAQPRSSSE